MPCTSELNRAQDKYTAYQNAQADAVAALIVYESALAALAVACPFFWTGFGGVACAAAATALAAATAALTAAVLKRDNAIEAYNWALDAYNNCIAKCKNS